MGRPIVDTTVPNPTASNNIWLECADGHVDRVAAFLDAGVDVNAQDDTGYSPLHAAASYNHVELVRFLLSKGANPNIADEDGDTPLHVAEDPTVLPIDVAAEDDRDAVVVLLAARLDAAGISYTLPAASDDDEDDLAHVLASDDEADNTPARDAAMARIERALQRSDLADGEAGDQELHAAVTELVLEQFQAGRARGAAAGGSSSGNSGAARGDQA
ncbi:hypothetical protein AMAG_16154 [Allomyces macrogynus ATCC 38327]|uniref:Uncharacterized protein n=1 Tax=Allomyces macrogynus (strain ATCC 38327) TaxID=578462 RepID=A0A0L0TA24_ALLM3|nr:hypothetical protein AMAG_16154 [Allomyces macrogynus ATCC 38327]|eukprot:KNE71592.1 hypothetical protein AMAG_16154 [Allomyces macrogynus ATCC 38327]